MGSGLVLVGVILPVATVYLLPFLVPVADSEDYGAGLLAITIFMASFICGLVLCGSGVFRLFMNLRHGDTAPNNYSYMAAGLGAISLAAMLGYAWFFIAA
jgi:hypothetical protein